MSEKYKSADCSFYDELEMLAVSGKSCEIIFRNENEAKTIARDRIKNLFTKGSAEYLETEKGLKIRLDKLIEIDGKKPLSQC